MKIEKIRIGDLTLNANNIRKDLNVDDLIDSIEESGVLIPLIVTPDMLVVDGNRRLEAARRVYGDDAMITVEIKDLTEQEIIEYSLITALQREDLTEKEKATAYKNLSLFGLSDLAIAKKVGKKKAKVREYINAADASNEAWDSHSLEELQFIAEFPELANYHDKELISRYDKLVAKKKTESWLENFVLPDNAEMSTTERWYENKGHGFDGLVIKSDNKLYHSGEVIIDDYRNYPYAPDTLMHVVMTELWVLEPKQQENATESVVEPTNSIEKDESDLYEECLKIWSGVTERVLRKIDELVVTKEPALTLIDIVCRTYGFDDLQDMAKDSFYNLAIEPFYMRDGKVEYRECECIDFIKAMTTLSDEEREVVNDK